MVRCNNRRQRPDGMVPGPFLSTKQCIISPALLPILIDYILWSCHFVGGGQLNEKHTIFNGDFADDNLILCYERENLQQRLSLKFAVACLDGVYTAQEFCPTLRQSRKTLLLQCKRISSSIKKNLKDFIKYHYCRISWCRHDDNDVNRHLCMSVHLCMSLCMCLLICVHPQGEEIIFKEN